MSTPIDISDVLVGFEFEFSINSRAYNSEITRLRVEFMRKFYATHGAVMDHDDIDMMFSLFPRAQIRNYIENVWGPNMGSQVAFDHEPEKHIAHSRALWYLVGETILRENLSEHINNIFPNPQAFTEFSGTEPLDFIVQAIIAGDTPRALEMLDLFRKTGDGVSIPALYVIQSAISTSIASSVVDWSLSVHNMRDSLSEYAAEFSASVSCLPYGKRRRLGGSSDFTEYEEEFRALTWFLRRNGIRLKDAEAGKDNTFRSYNTAPGFYLETDYQEELISDPQPVEDAIVTLRNICTLMQKYFTTTKEDGIHINISVPGKTQHDYDMTKIWIAANPDAFAAMFNREDNTYCESLDNSFKGVLAAVVASNDTMSTREFQRQITGVRGHLRKRMNAEFRNRTGYAKCKAVNFTHLEGNNPYVEFRVCGNAKYEQRVDDLEVAVRTFAEAVKIGTCPALKVDWYTQQIATKVNAIGRGIPMEYRVGPVPPHRKLLNMLNVFSFFGDANTILSGLMSERKICSISS